MRCKFYKDYKAQYGSDVFVEIDQEGTIVRQLINADVKLNSKQYQSFFDEYGA